MASDLLGEIVVIKRNGGDGARFPLKAKQCIFGRYSILSFIFCSFLYCEIILCIVTKVIADLMKIACKFG